MRYQISGKQIDIGEALQTHVKAELGEVVEKYAQRPTECTVVATSAIVASEAGDTGLPPIGPTAASGTRSRTRTSSGTKSRNENPPMPCMANP